MAEVAEGTRDESFLHLRAGDEGLLHLRAGEEEAGRRASLPPPYSPCKPPSPPPYFPPAPSYLQLLADLQQQLEPLTLLLDTTKEANVSLRAFSISSDEVSNFTTRAFVSAFSTHC